MSEFGGATTTMTLRAGPAWASGRPRRDGLRRRTVLGLSVGLTLLLVVAAGAAAGPEEQQYLTAAATARAAYRYDRALDWYSAASTNEPADPRPHCLAGEVLLLQGEPRAAEAAYQACVARAPGDGTAWLGLGRARSLAGDLQGAEAAWERTAALGVDDGLRQLGALYESLGRFAEAEAIWARLPANDGQVLAHRGLLALWRGDAGTASADFAAARQAGSADEQRLERDGLVALADAPLSGAAGLGHLGYAFLVGGMPQLALQPLQQAVALAPRMGDAHAYLGWTLWLLGRQAEARAEIAQGTLLAPKLSFAWFAAAEVVAAGGDTTTGLADLRQALDLDAHNPELWAETGRMELAQHNYIPAELALGNAAQLSNDPIYTILLLHLYVDYHFGLTTGRAFTAASTAVERFPKSEPVQFLLAEVLDQLGRSDEAYYAATTAQALDPTDPGPYILLGQYAEDQGDYVTAALDLRTALALQPEGPEAGQARNLLGPLADIPV
jgi:tetratricopeptide (TPR) repeat protein